MEIRDWLKCTVASELMVRDLVTLEPDELVAEAAATLLREQISGAPVVDGEGRCVGVFSAIDVPRGELTVALEARRAAQSSFFNSGLVLPESVIEEELQRVREKLVPAAERPVGEFMTTDLVTITENSSAGEIIQRMIDGHIHRIVVIDQEQKLVGLVSTTDLLAGLLQAGLPD